MTISKARGALRQLGGYRMVFCPVVEIMCTAEPVLTDHPHTHTHTLSLSLYLSLSLSLSLSHTHTHTAQMPASVDSKTKCVASSRPAIHAPNSTAARRKLEKTAKFILQTGLSVWRRWRRGRQLDHPFLLLLLSFFLLFFLRPLKNKDESFPLL